nr:unnamed protein product [Digitaria exilis]
MARHHGIAAVGGMVYFEFTGNELGFLKFDDAEPSYKMVDVDMVGIHDGTEYWSSYLVESHGELFLAVVLFDGWNLYKIAEVAVYKMASRRRRGARLTPSATTGCSFSAGIGLGFLVLEHPVLLLDMACLAIAYTF